MNRPLTRVLLRLLVLAGVIGLAAALTFGYLGRFHAAFDSFAHFRLHIASALAIATPFLLLMRLWPEALFALVLSIASTVQTIGSPFAGDNAAQAAGGAVYRLLHMNLRYDNDTPQAALSLIGQIRPDVITLAEVSEAWRQKLTLLEASYPYRILCPPPSPIGGVAILSRRPFSEDFEPACADRGAFAHAKLDIGGRTVDIATVHLGWPWPFEQPWQLPTIEPLLAELGETAIIAGDLNAVPWSHTARRVAVAADARLLSGIGPTWLHGGLPQFLRPWIGLPIDNLLIKGAVSARHAATSGPVGSDHLPVVLEFSLPAAEKPADVLQATLIPI